MSITLGEIATRLGCELAGDPDTLIAGVATLSLAGEGTISFFANSAYQEALKSTDASAVILKEADLEQCKVSALISTNPYLTFAKVADLLYPDVAFEPGIHARATVADSARVDETAHVAANAFIDEDCEIGEHAYARAGCCRRSSLPRG